jgi:hypothetical protein
MNQVAPAADLPRLLRVAQNQRNIMFCILAQLAVGLVGWLGLLPALVQNLVSLVVGIASIIFTIALARVLYSMVGVVVCVLFLLVPFSALVAPNVAGFLPLVSLLTLLVVNQRATKELRAAGFRVGLMGGDPAEVAARMPPGAG